MRRAECHRSSSASRFSIRAMAASAACGALSVSVGHCGLWVGGRLRSWKGNR